MDTRKYLILNYHNISLNKVTIYRVLKSGSKGKRFHVHKLCLQDLTIKYQNIIKKYSKISLQTQKEIKIFLIFTRNNKY